MKLGAPPSAAEIAAFEGDATVAVLVLAADTSSVADAARQIVLDPAVRTIFIHPDTAREPGLLARLKPKKTVPRAIRASALLVHGCVDLGAGVEDGVDWVWGRRAD